LLVLAKLPPSTGLIGYPTFGQDGIVLKAIFNPNINMNDLIRVDSVVPKASGTWRVTKLSHTLETNIPETENAWHSDIIASYEKT